MPTSVTRELNPKLGSDGATTWKEGPSLFSLSNGSSFETSMKLPGPGKCERHVMGRNEDSHP